MDALPLELVVIAVTVFFASIITAALSAIYRAMRRGASKLSFVIFGTVIPLLMLIDGLYLEWKWRGIVTDMLGPPGPWLLMAALPSWLACLLVSRAILLDRKS